MQKNLKTLVYGQWTLLFYLENKVQTELIINLIFYKDLNFRISDSMNDFILIILIEFNIKSSIFHISYFIKFFKQKISLK